MAGLSTQIPPRALRVVELGCGRGETGAAFLRRQPSADYWGFETEAAQVRKASQRLGHALRVRPEELDFAACGLYSADVLIVRGRYLQGLTAARLKALAAIVDEEGQLLLEIPNPGYVRRVLAQLGAQDSPPPLSGHTLAAWQQMGAQAGFASAQAMPDYSPREDKDLRESGELKALLQAFRAFCQQQKWQVKADVWARGWLLRFSRRPLPASERMVVHAVLGEALVTASIRISEPGGFLQTEPGVRAVQERLNYDVKLDEGFGQVVLIRQRIRYKDWEQARPIIEGQRRYGCLILAEMDDNPMLWMKQPDERKYSIDFMGVHGVQVSTEPLAELVRQYNPHVKVFRNHLPELPEARDYASEAAGALAKLGRPQEAYDEAPVTVFFGALNRDKDWQDIMPALNDAARRYGERLRFLVLADKGFFDALQTPHKQFLGRQDYYEGRYVPYAVYQKALHAADISLLPLHDTAFNRTKSDLKFIESAGHGAAVLASPTVYEDTLQDGRTGFLYRNPGEFAERLRLLIENRPRRLEMAAAAYAYVRSGRLLSQHYMERLAWYRELCARREELDRELAARLAKLNEVYGKAVQA